MQKDYIQLNERATSQLQLWQLSRHVAELDGNLVVFNGLSPEESVFTPAVKRPNGSKMDFSILGKTAICPPSPRKTNDHVTISDCKPDTLIYTLKIRY